MPESWLNIAMQKAMRMTLKGSRIRQSCHLRRPAICAHLGDWFAAFFPAWR